MKTDIVLADETATAKARAVEELRAGNVVALPTETVYGLAANALDVSAALKVFDAKERPRFDPLIVHLPDAKWLERVAEIPAPQQRLVNELVERFWPGPLTLILPRRPIISDVITSGLETVAVRLSAHPVFRNVIEAFGGPLAAPSANRFGHISPTTAEHVHSELEDRIPLIIDGGATSHGLESTIIAIREGRIEILRHGPVTAEQLQKFAPVRTAPAPERPDAPGQLPSHYAPKTRLMLVPSLRQIAPVSGRRVGALAWRSTELAGFADGRTLSPSGDLKQAASNLFRYLRELDAAGFDLIVAEQVPEHGLGAAIMDRLHRAAA